MQRTLFGTFAAALLFTLIMSTNSFAQPSWLKSAIESIPTIPPHKDASALILLNVLESKIERSGHATTHVRYAVKLLKAAAKDQAVLHQPVVPWTEVKGLKGWLIQPDGTKYELTDKSIVRVAHKLAAGYYDDAHVLGAAFLQAAEGSIVGYEYDIEERSSWGAFFQEFVFQTQEPTLLAQYSLELPADWTAQVAIANCDSCSSEQVGTKRIWTARNLPYRQEEPLAPSWHLLARRVRVNCFGPVEGNAVCFANWAVAAGWVAGMLDSATTFTPPLAEFSRRLTDSAVSEFEKARLIADFVQSQVRYVAVEIGKGRLIPRQAAATLANRYGDCKDKAALMRAMLKSIGIASSAALAAIDDPIDTAVSSPFQFNHCIVAIPTAQFKDLPALPNAMAGNWIFFDPTEPSIHLGHLPPQESESYVLVGDAGSTNLVRLPAMPEEENRRVYRAEAVLNPDGSMSAEVTMVDYGARAAATAYDWATTTEREELDYIRKRLSPSLSNVALSDYRTEDFEDSARAFFRLSAGNAVMKSGEVSLLRADFLREDLTPIFKVKERSQPITFGIPLRGEMFINWHLGAWWTVTETQTAPMDSCVAGAIRCSVTAGDTMVTYSVIQDFSGRQLPANDYEIARKFRRTMEAARSLRILLRQKENRSAK